ncbi:MAG: ATP synthase F0 subunit B [Nitrospirota bacterium]
MIEFELKWFLVLLGNFLALLLFLNFFLFKPVLNLLLERSEKISKSLEEAKEIQRRSEEAMAELNKEIASAREKGRNLFLKLQKEGFAEQRRLLDKSKDNALETIEKTKGELKGDTEKARALLREEAGRLSLEIARKVLGREI